MNSHTAQNILKIVGSVHLGWKYNNLVLARKICNDGGVIEKSEWHSGWQHSYQLKPNIHEEKTYEGCTPGALTLTSDNKFQISLNIYDGENYLGEPTSLRCTFVITFDEMFEELEPHLTQAIRKKAKSKIEQEDQDAYERRIQRAINNLLS
jgi:hypothetical protein